MNPAAKSCALHILNTYPEDNVMLAGICKTVARHVWPHANIGRASFILEHDSKGVVSAWALQAWSKSGAVLLECYEDIDLGLTAARALVVVVEGM